MKTLLSIIIATLALHNVSGGELRFFVEIDGQILSATNGWTLTLVECKPPSEADVTEDDENGVPVTHRVSVPEKVQFVFQKSRMEMEEASMIEGYYHFVFSTPMTGERPDEKFEVIHQAPGIRTTLKDRGFNVHCTEWSDGELKSIAIDWEGGKLRINSSVP